MFYDLCTNDLIMSIHEEKHLKFCKKKDFFCRDFLAGFEDPRTLSPNYVHDLSAHCTLMPYCFLTRLVLKI